MPKYIMLTRLIGEEVEPSFAFIKREKEVADKIRQACPKVKWLADYAIIGPYDYLDIFEASDNDEAIKVAVLAREYGKAQTEIWPAIEWNNFKEIMRDLADVIE